MLFPFYPTNQPYIYIHFCSPDPHNLITHWHPPRRCVTHPAATLRSARRIEVRSLALERGHNQQFHIGPLHSPPLRNSPTPRAPRHAAHAPFNINLSQDDGPPTLRCGACTCVHSRPFRVLRIAPRRSPALHSRCCPHFRRLYPQRGVLPGKPLDDAFFIHWLSPWRRPAIACRERACCGRRGAAKCGKGG